MAPIQDRPAIFPTQGWDSLKPTAVLVLQDGLVLPGFGFGATGRAAGEVCFNTAMTGYEEILTDPSYAGQIVTFTFPHIGNVGANIEDVEAVNPAVTPGARGMVARAPIGAPSNWRANERLENWLARRGVIGIYGVDTRALTSRIRESGMPNAVIAHAPDGDFDLDALKAEARKWPGIDGMDLVPDVTASGAFGWDQTSWRLETGYGHAVGGDYRVVAIDYGVKTNILRLLTEAGCAVTVVPATATTQEIMALRPDGVFLSNGPGDPAETGKYAVPVIQDLLDRKVPIFGICLGHQLLSLALGARTEKMRQGHHGANHPVKDVQTGKVEITSMNHGFSVARDSLPKNARETHVSLFDGTNCGLELTDRPVFSVQHHPEASPGPQDSRYLFQRFTRLMAASRQRPDLR